MALTLKDVYSNCQNPLDKPSFVSDLINDYIDSTRMYKYMSGGMYDNLVENANSTDNSKTDVVSKEKFWVDFYNSWIKNITSLNQTQISTLKSQGYDVTPLKNYLTSFGYVHNLDDINRLKSNSIFLDNKNSLQLFDGWEHIKSRYASGMLEKSIDVKHRIYINAIKSDIYKISNLFRERCEQQGIPYYFKFNPSEASNRRADTIVIYSDDNNLAKYVDILQSIKQDYPDLASNCGNPPKTTATYDSWLGIADEPEPIFDDNYSYNQVRALVLEEGIEQTVLDEIYSFKGSSIIINGKMERFNDILRQNITESMDIPFYMGYSKYQSLTDVQQQQIKSEVMQGLTNDVLSKCFGKIEQLKDNRHETSNIDCGMPFIKIPTTYGELGISVDNLDQTLKKMIPLLKQLDSDFEKKAKENILKRCNKRGIDRDSFAFNISTKNLVLGQGVKSYASQTTQNTQSQQNNVNQTQQPQQNSTTGAQQSSVTSTNTSQTNQTFTTATMGFRPVPKPSAPTPTMIYKSQSLQDKIDFLKSLQLEGKKNSDFASELNGKSGVTTEDLSCAYAITQNGKSNVQDLTYREIEKTLFEIVNFPDYNQANTMLKDYMQVLNNAGYIPSYGTLARALNEMDKLENSNLDNTGARKDLLRDALGKGNQMLEDSMKISEYIKGQNNISSPVTHEEQSKVLLKMQDNYDKFGLNSDSNKPQNFKKFIDPQTLPKPNSIILNVKSDKEMQADIDWHCAYKDYAYQSCPYTIKKDNGEVQDIWNIQPSTLINKLARTLTHGNAMEIQKMRIICENMKGHFKPSYNDMAKLTMIINDFWKLGNDPNVDRAIESLKNIVQDKFNEGLQIAKFNAQKEGRPQATYGDMVKVFNELEKQQQLKKQAQQTSGGYSSGM